MLRFFVFCMVSCFSFETVISVNYKENYFDQHIDHFNFVSYGDRTFKQRYLYNDTWWTPGEGPIFFYAGNEGDILQFWNNTGFMLEIAPQFQALVLFAEHRFYGKSLPFGNSSFELPGISVLTMEQALADYVFLLTGLKRTYKAENCTVISFGGSLGGVLAAYMRFKYPNIVHGVISASSYLFGFSTGNIDGFFQSVTKDFRNALPNCESQVRAAFSQIQEWAAVGQAGYEKISRNFHLCNPISTPKDFDHFLRWIRNVFVFAAMVDYPYPTTFLGSFPAYPVNVMCNLLTSTTPVSGMYEAVALYYNSTQNVSCNDIYEQYVYTADSTGSGVGADGKVFDYQACTQLSFEGGTDGVTDMFPVLPFNSTMRDEYCLKTWNVRPRRNCIDVMYWGRDISSSSNIVFSNGDLDPWFSGGVLCNISSSILAIIIEGGAHHLDLRGSNPADPQSVIDARVFEVNCIKKWLSTKL